MKKNTYTIQDVPCMPLWESPVNTRLSSNLISHVESTLSQLLNLKDIVSIILTYKMGAIKRPTRKANAVDYIALCR